MACHTTSTWHAMKHTRLLWQPDGSSRAPSMGTVTLVSESNSGSQVTVTAVMAYSLLVDADDGLEALPHMLAWHYSWSVRSHLHTVSWINSRSDVLSIPCVPYVSSQYLPVLEFFHSSSAPCYTACVVVVAAGSTFESPFSPACISPTLLKCSCTAFLGSTLATLLDGPFW